MDEHDTSGVIIAAAIGYGITEVRPFLSSLQRTGYSGATVLLLDRNVADSDLAAMRELGVTPYLVRNNSWFVRGSAPLARATRLALRSPVGRAGVRRMEPGRRLHLQSPSNRRFRLYAELVEAQPDLFAGTRWVFLTDVRDVHFQHDPSELFATQVAQGPLQLFAEGPPQAEDGVFSIGQATSTDRWIRGLAGDATADRLATERVLCSGTILLATDLLVDLAGRVAGQLVELQPGGPTFGYDQGALNLLYYEGALDDLHPVVNDNGSGGLATLGAIATDDSWQFDGAELTMGGAAPPVVHQYDRVPVLTAAWA